MDHTHRSYASQTGAFVIDLDWMYDDHYDFDVQDEDGNDCAETKAKLDDGEWAAFASRVAIYWVPVPDGERVLIGEDSLWGSIYASPDEMFGNGIGGYLTDMRGEAMRQAREFMRGVNLPKMKA